MKQIDLRDLEEEKEYHQQNQVEHQIYRWKISVVDPDLPEEEVAVVDPVLALHAEEVVVDQTIVVETTAVVLAMVVAMAVVADVAVKTTNSDDAHVTMTIMNLDEGQKMMIMSLECAQGIVPHQDNLHRLRDRVPGQLIRETSQEEQTRETTTKQDRRVIEADHVKVSLLLHLVKALAINHVLQPHLAKTDRVLEVAEIVMSEETREKMIDNKLLILPLGNYPNSRSIFTPWPQFCSRFNVNFTVNAHI